MSTRLERTWRILVMTVLLVPVIFGTGCSGDDDDDAPPASSFVGTFVSSSDTGSFSFESLGGEDLFATILSASVGEVMVSGTFFSDIGSVRLETPSGSTPFVQILGSFEGNIFIGITAGALGNGSASAIPDNGNSAVAFCGTFTRSSGDAGGRFNLVVGSGLAQATLFDELIFQSSTFGGSVSGAVISLDDGEGLTASGTIDGSTVSGIWSAGTDGGDWSGSTAACGTN